MSGGESSLWRDRRFNVFWFGQTLSSVGDAFTAVAFPLLIYRSTGSIEKMTAITACFAVGAILSGLLSGPLVDRVDRRGLLLVADLLRAVLMAAIPVSAHYGGLSFPFLAVVAVSIGLLGNVFGVAYVAFVPELVSKTRVTQANARLQASAAASFVVGPALAGLATESWGPANAIGLDAVSFVVSFASLLVIRGKGASTQRAPTGRRDLVAGIVFMAKNPTLRAFVLVYGGEILITAATLDLFTFHLKNTLGESDARVGTMFAIASLGAVAGASLSTQAKARLGTQLTFVLTSIALAAGFALASLAASFVFTAAIAVAFTFSSTMRSVLSMSRRQEVTPDGLLGRVTAAFWLALAGLRTVGATFTGIVATRYGNAMAFRSIAVGMVALTVVTLFARSLRDAPDVVPAK